MDKTPEEVLGEWTILALGAHGGSGRVVTILDEVDKRFGSYLTEKDLEVRAKGELSWRNSARWRRKRLVENGILEPSSVSGFGVWKLTDAGFSLYEKLNRSSYA